MKRKHIMLALWALFLTVAWVAPSFAEFVFVTPNGKKYHPENSRFLKGKQVEKISKEEAEARGLEPSREYLKYLQSLEQQKTENAGQK